MVSKSKKSLKSKSKTKLKTKMGSKTLLNGAIALIAIYGAFRLYKQYINPNTTPNINGNTNPNRNISVNLGKTIQMEDITQEQPEKQNLT